MCARTSYVCPDTGTARLPHLAGSRDPDPACVHEIKVEVAPSNCVQCGAITAKGGRLTPPEGGSGPEYTLT